MMPKNVGSKKIERVIEYICKIASSRFPVKLSEFDEYTWGSKSTFKKFRREINNLWEINTGKPFVKYVDSSGNPNPHKNKMLVLDDYHTLAPGRTTRLASVFAYLKFLKSIERTIIYDELQGFFSGWLNDLNRGEKTSVRRFSQKFHCVTKGEKNYSYQNEILDSIYNALLKEFHIIVNTNSLEKRKIRPLSLVYFNQSLYLLFNFVSGKNLKKVYKLKMENINSIESLPHEKFDYPINFNPEDQFKNHIGIFTNDSDPEVLVCLEFDKASWVNNFLTSRVWVENQKFENSGDKVRLSMKLAYTDEIKWWVLGMGDQIKIIKPDILRSELNSILKSALEKYR